MAGRKPAIPFVLVVLLKVDVINVTAVEFESDAPWSVDMNGIPRRVKTLQWVKIETWQVHIPHACSSVQRVKPHDQPLMHPLVDLCRVTIFEKRLK